MNPSMLPPINLEAQVIELVAALPEHAGAWIAAALGLVLIASTVGGVAVKVGNQAIVSSVRREVHAEVPKVVAVALREVNAKLDGIRVHQTQIQDEVAVVRRLEAKIENGMATSIAEIKQRQSDTDRQVSEMHGWMRANQEWDGHNRRDDQ